MRGLTKNKKYLEFDVVGSPSFDPVITAPKTGQWNFGDGTISDSNSPTKVYGDTATYAVKYWLRELSTITVIDMNTDGVAGELNLSNVTNLGGTFLIYSNTALTSIVNPTSSQLFTAYYAHLCNLTGNLNVSMLSNLGGLFIVYSNPNLTSITNPTNTRSITNYYVYGCNLTGTLDISGLSGLSGIFRAYSNINLTSITNPSNSNTFTSYAAYGCNLDYINFTTLTNMTGIDNCSIRLENNAMTVGDVNHILVDLDTISVGGFTGRSIDISGTNAAPDGTSGGFDGTTAVTNLTAKGFTVTTS